MVMEVQSSRILDETFGDFIRNDVGFSYLV